MKPVSLSARINAVEFLISQRLSPGAKIKTDTWDLAIDHARQAISALIWLRDDPEAQALMRAQAERKRAAEGAKA